MKKNIKHQLIKKGNKKLRLHFVSCWLGLHNWQVEETVPCDLTQNGKIKGSCNMTLYYCKKCGKQKLVASEIACS